MTSGPDATSSAPGTTDIFYRGPNNRLWHLQMTAEGYYGVEDLGGPPITSDGILYHRWYPVPLPPEEPPPPPPEICLNNEDDNSDGTVDEEPCQTPPPVGEPEICGNRIDDDLDGVADESPPCELVPEEP
jgi:hypothetical protein